MVGPVRSWLRRHPFAASALATVIAAGGALVIAYVTGADQVGRAFESVQPGWIALIAGAEALAYPAYALAYRSVAQVHGHAPMALPLVGRVVVAGFGPFALAGGFGIDKQALHALHEDERSARVGVLHTLISHPRKYAGAWIGTALYWAADITAFYAALRTFGLDMGAGKVILAYATGYAATRRSLPLGGAGVTEVLMTYALYW